MADSVWTEGPCLISSALTADIPLKVMKHPQTLKTDSLDKADSKQGSTERKETKTKCRPCTGIEVFEIFTQKKHLGGIQFHHLKVSDEGPYRPYDLHVVPYNKAGPDHYIFSPTSVIHVKDGCSAGVLNLAEWYREAVLWKALRDIPFFRDYLLYKTFTRLTEKLKEVHWLPQDESQTYTLTEFQTTLMKSNQQSQSFLEKFLHYCSVILTTVQETCYKTYQEIHQQVEELSQSNKPLHLQHSLNRSLHKKLNQTGQVLHRLGNFKALMNCMIVQNLVSVIHSGLMIYLNKILKREEKNQYSLFQTELTFGGDGQLILVPSMDLFQDLLLRALQSVVGSTLQSGSALTSTGSFPNKEESYVTSKIVLPKLSLCSLQGQKLQRQVFHLSTKKLEWHLHHHAGAQEVEKQQGRLVQEALQEIQQLCERHTCLVDAYLFASQRNPAALENMRGWPASKYKEHIQMIQYWINKVHHVPAAFTTSNKLITINCSHIQERLEPLLDIMEKDVLNFLSEDLWLCGNFLTNDLKKFMECHKLEPTDLNEFANYVSMTFALSNQLGPLLRIATERVMQQTPSMINTLDNTFSSLTKQLENLVSSATTGTYLDLSQNSAQIIPELRLKYRQLHIISAQLNELSETNQSLRGQPFDLSFVMTAKQNMEARKELWELKDISTAKIQEWSLILFSQFVVSEAQDKLNEWLQRANSVAKVISPSDEMLQDTVCVFEKFSQQLSLIAKLSSPTMKHKHWANIFKEVDLLVDQEQNLTVGDLMSRKLLEHQHKISKICSEAKAAADMEQAFQRLQQSWEGTVFRLTKFIHNVCQMNNPQYGATQQLKPSVDIELTQKDSQQNSCGRETFTIMELEILMAQAEDSVMSLSSMLMSPHICDLKREIKRFSPVDKMFRELIQAISRDPLVLNFVRLRKTGDTDCDFHGQCLRIILMKGLTEMDEICSQLLYLLDSARHEFPRLCFLSDSEMIELLSLHPTPTSLLPFVRKCFRGVQWFEVDHNSKNDMTNQNSELDLPSTQMWINGVYGMLKEHVPFNCPLRFKLNPVVCLDNLEKELHQTVKQKILKYIAARQCLDLGENIPEQNKEVDDNISTSDQAFLFITSGNKEEKTRNAYTSSFVKLISEYPLQCILVGEEWKSIKAQNTAKLQSLCKAVQYMIADSYNSTLAKQHTVTALRAIILLIMKHSQQIDGLVDIKSNLESSFEWQRLIKYHHSVTVHDWSNVGQDTPCYNEDSIYVDVFGTQLAYGNEYIGPENWMMVNTTSTERAHLGILLALTSYKCAFISGPHMSGKQRTALQLGWALGQQVIMRRCCSNTSFPVVCQMLLGALQSGAWLVLSSVDSLEQGILSMLGQCLTDIHQCLSIILENGQQNELQGHNDKIGPNSIVRNFVQTHSKMMIECQVLSGEKKILAKPSYGCIIISSNGYSAEIPENLRITTRPVSLVQPDCSIIAEVLLISLGFSEATDISRRLISLLGLGKDLFCLPEYVCRDQCSWLVLLRKVIDASGIYLSESHEDRTTDVSFKASENILQDYHLPSYKLTSKSSMSNAVREEQALIKGIMSVLLSAISEHNRAFQFCTIFEEMFPAAKYCPDFQYIIEESERNALRNAVTDQLQQTAFCADSEILKNALTLHQTLKFSKTVVILGPAGSGKTTLYRTLAGALRRLSEASVEENVADTNLLSHSCWCSVDTMTLFPNALSHEELFGACCEQTGSWRDGAFTKVLRDTERYEFSVQSLTQIKQKLGVQKVKWLVLDGEPLTCPKWFDTLSTLGNPENPCLCLSSGMTIHLSQVGLKILVEATSLGEATPSALARCSLVCISGINVWKNVWKTEIDMLYREHVLNQNTLKMWKCLAEDLFSSTIIFLRHKGLNSVMTSEGPEASKSSPEIINGLQEVTSFIKILHALLGDSGKCNGLKSTSKQKRDNSLKLLSTELHARNLFVIAYIWGFGGQLHPRHWPQFDIFAREALFKCRYKIEVPVKGSVFEHFFNLGDEMLEGATCMSSFTKTMGPRHSCTSVPQYKKYAYLLDCLLKAHYPALLVGEAGSGKTILCKTLLQERPHLHVPASPRLCSADLRNIHERIRGRKTSLDSSDPIMWHQRSLLFIDDLHEPAFGKPSATLETLRECISRDRVQTSDGYHFKLISSGAVSYLGTCRTHGTHKSGFSQISPRLFRLFAILVLPEITADILYSIHSSQLQQIEDMAHCIVAATFDVYLAVCEHLSSSVHSPHIVFSLYDLQKVFQGMFLYHPKTTSQYFNQRKPSFSVKNLSSSSMLAFDPARNILSIARLWMHECMRTFGDRLSSNEESQELVSFLSQASEKNFGSKLVLESQIFGEMPDLGCQFKSVAIADINQHKNMTMQQDNVECIASRKVSATPPKVVLTKDQMKLKLKMTESECSEELSSSTCIAAYGKTHTISIWLQQLLHEISSSIHDVVFSPEFSKVYVYKAKKQLNHNVVYQERDLNVLIKQLTNIVKSKEATENYCKYAKFAVYHKRVQQLIHILRALLIPNGHGILFGAAKKTGRKTTLRLAAYLTGYQLIEVHCGNEVKLKELLKDARCQIDMHGEHVVFMVHENTSQATRDELLLIMETWHHVDEELKEERPHISAVVKNSSDQRIGQHTYETETEQSSVIARQITKALTLCCCVEVYHPWSTKALVEIASVHLKDSVDDNNLLASIAQAMAAIHQSATKYASTFLNTMYIQLFNPQTYIELIENFRHLCDHLNEQLRSHANKLATALDHLNELTFTAQNYSQEAFRLKVKFQEAQTELSQLQMVMDTERAVCKQTHQQCLLEENCLSYLQGQLDIVEKQNQNALKEELQFFDHSKLSNELFEELGQIVQAPNFQTDLVCDVSQACESLCSWVRAVYQYACVKHCMAPQEAHKKHLNNCMAEIRARLQVARLQEEAAQERLEVIEKQQQFVRNNLKALSAQVQKVEIQEKEAAVSIKQISDYIEKWNMAKKETEMNKHTIPGDALLLAAVLTYLGPFGPEIRLELLKKWHKMCLTGKITISPEDVRASLIDEPQFLSPENDNFANIPVAMELHRALSQALGRDQHLIQTVSPSHVLKLLLWGHKPLWAHKWGLLTDTQQHKERSSLTGLTEYSNQFPVNARGSQQDEEFELIVSADDPEFIHKISDGAKKEIHPLILAKVKVIDLSLSTSEVQHIILSDLIHSKCSELWLKHCQFQRDKQVLQDKLHAEEVSLVDYILQSSTPLLQDPEFLPYVQLHKKSSLRLQAQIEELSTEMDGCKAVMNDFHCITALATALYNALQDVGRLYPFYFFPLCNFLIALRESLAPKGWLDVPCSAEMGKGVVISDISHRIVSHLFAHYGPYLFQNHAELLRLFFSVAFFMHTEGCSEIECAVFLRGFSDIESAEYSTSAKHSATLLPSWIPTHTKADLGLLEKISPFHGLISSLKNSSRQWQEYFQFPSATVVGPVPCQSYSQLTTLQHAILWKTFCPQWLAAVVDDLSACQQGQNIQSAVAGCSPTSSPEALSNLLSRNKSPVIVTMSNQLENGPGSIHPLHWIKHSAEMKMVKVVVLTFGSKFQRDDLLSSLNTAVQTGCWLVLDNCHLLDHWDPRVITQLRQLISCPGKGHWMNKEADAGLNPIGEGAGNQVHPQFRLWLITKGSAPLSIPAFIRMSAMHLVFDSQWDLKDELCSSFRQVTSTVHPAMNMVDPILQAAVLHSVLMQRQKVKHLGHGSIYKWSYEDLLALTEAHARLAKLCHDPVGALEYVADEDILKAVQHCIETTVNTNDTLLLGFSAEMKNDIVKIRTARHCDDMLKHFPELKDYQKAQERLQKLQTHFEWTKKSRGVVLETRANLLEMYQMEECSGSPPVYSLSAFANPRGILAALIRETVYIKQCDISQVTLHFQVLGNVASPAFKLSNGIRLSGLVLHGASWDTQPGALQDTLSPNPCPFPLLWVRAKVRKSNLSYSSHSSPSNACAMPLYNCPLYLDMQSKYGEWNLSADNIVTYVPLMTKLDPVLCKIRRVKLVSALQKNVFR
ncbi:hypothetical protein Q7C36_016273 [Tachysurus vachellii]|uniref:Dynein heavy chain domain-containing protein 1 n=1 Tax=Tachysurus vachellii TaxID=175792 RepID=A0AA88M775_TACVA|nr:hypothetical protein Q7C36_016273 [Tachysurus vachellii]